MEAHCSDTWMELSSKLTKCMVFLLLMGLKQDSTVYITKSYSLGLINPKLDTNTLKNK